MEVRVKPILGVMAAASVAVAATAGPAAASRAQCVAHRPHGAVVPAHGENGKAILFDAPNGRRYGCAFDSGVVRRLPGEGRDPDYRATFTLQRNPFGLRGRWVAYASD